MDLAEDNGERNSCPGNRVSEYRDGGQKELGGGEGGFQRGVPLERFPRTLEGVG